MVTRCRDITVQKVASALLQRPAGPPVRACVKHGVPAQGQAPAGVRILRRMWRNLRLLRAGRPPYHLIPSASVAAQGRGLMGVCPWAQGVPPGLALPGCRGMRPPSWGQGQAVGALPHRTSLAGCQQPCWGRCRAGGVAGARAARTDTPPWRAPARPGSVTMETSRTCPPPPPSSPAPGPAMTAALSQWAPSAWLTLLC